MSKLEGESSGLSEAEAYASVRSHLGLYSDTPFACGRQMKWKNETKTEKMERTFHLPHPYFNKSQGEWENGQLHVIVSQRMSAGSRDLTKIFSCKMA